MGISWRVELSNENDGSVADETSVNFWDFWEFQKRLFHHQNLEKSIPNRMLARSQKTCETLLSANFINQLKR